VTDPNYAAFTALDPFFDIVQQGLAGLVDGDHYFDTIADDAEFEFRYHFPGWPETVRGCGALMALYAGYGNNIVLHGADGLVMHRSQDPRVVIIEYDIHGKIAATGSSYDNRFISVALHRGPKDRAMAGLYGFAGSDDRAPAVIAIAVYRRRCRSAHKTMSGRATIRLRLTSSYAQSFRLRATTT